MKTTVSSVSKKHKVSNLLVYSSDVIRLVEPAEYAHLRELGYSCKQYELQMFVSPLEDGIKSFQNIAMMVFQ